MATTIDVQAQIEQLKAQPGAASFRVVIAPTASGECVRMIATLENDKDVMVAGGTTAPLNVDKKVLAGEMWRMLGIMLDDATQLDLISGELARALRTSHQAS